MFKPSRHTSSSPYKLILYFLLSLTFLILYALAAHAATLATALATAASYENNALPPCDLFSLFKSKWRGMFVNRPRRSKSPVRLLWYLWMAEITVAAPIAMFIPSPITIAVAGVLVVSFFIFVGGTAAAIAAVEDGCGLEAEGEEAGFGSVALNVSFNAALVAVALTCWWNVRLDLVVYGLFSANCVSVANVLWNVVYTVYYLRCGEYYDHGQMVVQFQGFHYTRLPPLQILV